MRIGLVSLHTSPLASPGAGDAGGMNVVVRHLGEALADLGHHVEILTRRESADEPDRLEVGERLAVRYLVAGPARPLTKSRQAAHTADFEQAMLRLGGDPPEGGPVPYDVLHSHHWMSGMAAEPVARRWGVPHVQSYHSIAALPDAPLGAGEPPESPDRNAGERHLAVVSDLLIAISHAEAATIADLGAEPARIAIVAPGVDTVMFRPREDTDLGEADGSDRGYALVAARLQPLKGIDLAIEALARVPPAIRPRLLVAGEVSDDFADYRRQLNELVVGHDLAEHVQFVGPRTRDELAGLLRDARLCLITSHSETFGLIALEAAASGTPVIAADSGGLREAVADGRSGLLVPERDPDAWAAAILTLLTDAEFSARLRDQARPWALGFSWERAAGEHASLYEAAVAEYDPRERINQ